MEDERSGKWIEVVRTWATDILLDPRDAVGIPLEKLWELADRAKEGSLDIDGLVYIPRVPTNAAEAFAMVALLNAGYDGCWYAGYTEDELGAVGGAMFPREQATVEEEILLMFDVPRDMTDFDAAIRKLGIPASHHEAAAKHVIKQKVKEECIERELAIWWDTVRPH